MKSNRINAGRALARACLSILSCLPVASRADTDPPLQLAASNIEEVTVIADRSNASRSILLPDTGGSLYRMSAAEVAALPQGADTELNQVLLQAPGVVGDSQGELHIRGDHGDIQYRINGVILPEGVSGFGQALDTRFAKSIDLLTGVLPAQYSYDTAGVVEIRTKDSMEQGGRADLYGGSHGTLNPSFELGGQQGDLGWYLSGAWLTNSLGIENPMPTREAVHDRTVQRKGFGYLAWNITPGTRISAMFGSYDGRFQIPDTRGQAIDPDGLGYGMASPGGFDSARLNEHQQERSRYGVIALQAAPNDSLDYQVAAFRRITDVRFTPDAIGDLAFNGVASAEIRGSESVGVQGDATWRVSDAHTLRFGLYASSENVRNDNAVTVFPVDGNGTVAGLATTIHDNSQRGGIRVFGLYAQDEWRLNDLLSFNAGLRADRADAYASEGQMSPRLGLVFKLTPRTTLHAGYARYFTPPPSELVSSSSLALYTGSSNAPENLRNSTVTSERAHYFDAGVLHQFSPTMSLGLDAYLKEVRNMLDEGQFGKALIATPFNYARGKIAGIELTANYRGDGFTAYANLARSRSLGRRIVSGEYNFSQEELDYVASHWVHTDHDQAWTASAGVAYQWGETQLSADASIGSGLRRGFANTEHLPGHVQVDLGASRQWKNTAFGTFEGRIAVVNVFDKSYLVRDGSGIGVGAPQYGPRRGVFEGLSRLF